MFKIPQGQFKFLTEDERHNIDWVSIDLKGDTGYFVEVDIDYPESIWEQTKDFPLAPENIDITHDMLSPFQKAALKNIYITRKHIDKENLQPHFYRGRKCKTI